MHEKNQRDWRPYSVGTLSTRPNHENGDCRRLSTVYHVTHVRHALEVIRDGKILPRLISDESRLNTKRILVIWLSPNRWHYGSRYGNVAFGFKWDSLIKGRNCYWVGCMPYSPPACRILITDKDRSGDLKVYDPTAGTGPWWHDQDTGEHYWNGELCLEVMLEETGLSIEKTFGMEFVKHHPDFCSVDRSSCGDLGQSDDVGGARFISGLCSEQLMESEYGVIFGLAFQEEDRVKPVPALERAWNALVIDIMRRQKNDYSGPITANHKASGAMARAYLGAFSKKFPKDTKALAGQFASEGDLIESCGVVMDRNFGLDQSLPR